MAHTTMTFPQMYHIQFSFHFDRRNAARSPTTGGE